MVGGGLSARRPLLPCTCSYISKLREGCGRVSPVFLCLPLFPRHHHHTTRYTGFVRGMNMDFGVSKAFGLPIELMEIPKTPDAFRQEVDDILGQGFSPQGKHCLGMQSHFAGKA